MHVQVHVQLQGDAGRTGLVVLPAGPKDFRKGATAAFDLEHLPFVGRLQVLQELARQLSSGLCSCRVHLPAQLLGCTDVRQALLQCSERGRTHMIIYILSLPVATLGRLQIIVSLPCYAACLLGDSVSTAALNLVGQAWWIDHLSLIPCMLAVLLRQDGDGATNADLLLQALLVSTNGSGVFPGWRIR